MRPEHPSTAPRTRGPVCGAVGASSGAPPPHFSGATRIGAVGMRGLEGSYCFRPFMTPYMACTRAMATKPTIRPTNTIINGSNMVVNFFRRCSSSRSK